MHKLVMSLVIRIHRVWMVDIYIRLSLPQGFTVNTEKNTRIN